MAIANLSAAARTESGKGASRAMRRDGRIPAIIYGHKRAPQSLSINAKELGLLLGRIAAEATVIELSVDGNASRTLIREIQRHPFKKQILHVDFQELVAGEKVTVRIPIRLVGTPEGVRLSGGIMDQTLRDLEIRVDPSIIPDHIDVDVSHLTVGHSIHVSELTLAEGIEVLTDSNATVCVCAIPKAVVEVTPAAEAEVTTDAAVEPELIRKVKPDDEGAATEEKK